MKHPFIPAILSALAATVLLAAEPETHEQNIAKHEEGAAKVADDQDDLSADVEQLVIEQTMPKVIELLDQVKDIMDESTDRLAKADTGGETIAAQTEIIEKIHAAAKEKQSQGQGGKSGSAMMDMMERMMGKKPDGDKSPGKGKKPSDKGGGGVTGDSDTANDATGGLSGGKTEVRRVPKAAGAASLDIPEEFKKAFDAYNRGAEKKVK